MSCFDEATWQHLFIFGSYSRIPTIQWLAKSGVFENIWYFRKNKNLCDISQKNIKMSKNLNLKQERPDNIFFQIFRAFFNFFFNSYFCSFAVWLIRLQDLVECSHNLIHQQVKQFIANRIWNTNYKLIENNVELRKSLKISLLKKL